jgi:environmental stress-induced protein Ves
MRPVVIRSPQHRRVRWRNGLGESFQVWPRGSAARNAGFQLNVTPIVAAGPFSHYPGIDRILVVTSGSLVFDGRDGELEPGDAIAFAGEEPMHARLPSGAARVFNLLMRRQCWRGVYTQYRKAQRFEPSPGDLVVVHAAAGSCSAEGVDLGEGATMLLRPGETCRIEPAGDGARLLAFRLSRR